MTRVTNFGIKRTYVQAGFENAAAQETSVAEPAAPTEEASTAPPPKKKRKRTKMSQRDGNKAKNAAMQEGAAEGTATEAVLSAPSPPKPAKKVKPKKSKVPYVSPSEARRLKRIEERNAGTTCFACRLTGHSLAHCPSAEGKKTVGICYRCNSTKHTLARCKKPADPLNPLPYASCFVCSGKGHLASACPQNKARGVYPNGGSCKLCGDTSHLAKDCGLRKQDSTQDSVMFGTGREAGADEDDFHTFKRRKVEVDYDEKQEVKMKRLIDVKAGAHSGIVKPFGTNPVKPIKKVVFF
ncbi:hypothetical protein C8F04DRAFT_211898 [Mycena alexandri]|uniref:CCHC-type domain-containing protein n=1 Tax=Mycena alexandri TaxID=1745969 RepID=A0AAD6TMD7_9AGAR|nr:hypothetical protein C8F04DRAFT_211898 [Mycena alexandri]